MFLVGYKLNGGGGSKRVFRFLVLFVESLVEIKMIIFRSLLFGMIVVSVVNFLISVWGWINLVDSKVIVM